jgi:hypothetical protein
MAASLVAGGFQPFAQFFGSGWNPIPVENVPVYGEFSLNNQKKGD